MPAIDAALTTELITTCTLRKYPEALTCLLPVQRLQTDVHNTSMHRGKQTHSSAYNRYLKSETDRGTLSRTLVYCGVEATLQFLRVFGSALRILNTANSNPKPLRPTPPMDQSPEAEAPNHT